MSLEQLKVFFLLGLRNISLENKGQAYSDAIEYKRSGLFVQTFQEFIAWDKNNGFKIKTPFNATYVFDKKEEKIIKKAIA